jgi:hypothetical protein
VTEEGVLVGEERMAVVLVVVLQEHGLNQQGGMTSQKKLLCTRYFGHGRR